MLQKILNRKRIAKNQLREQRELEFITWGEANPEKLKEALTRQKEAEQFASLMRSNSANESKKVTLTAYNDKKILIWNGGMYCYKCKYSWNSNRSTPPGKCAKCGSQIIVPIKQ